MDGTLRPPSFLFLWDSEVEWCGGNGLEMDAAAAAAAAAETPSRLRIEPDSREDQEGLYDEFRKPSSLSLSFFLSIPWPPFELRMLY